MSKNKKIRVDFIKNRGKAPRENDFTRDFKTDSEKIDGLSGTEQVRAKGEISASVRLLPMVVPLPKIAKSDPPLI